MIEYIIEKIIKEKIDDNLNEWEFYNNIICLGFVNLSEKEFKALWICVEKYNGRYTEPLDYKLTEAISDKLEKLL